MGFLSKNPDSHTHSFSFITQSTISAAHICMDIGPATGTRSIYQEPLSSRNCLSFSWKPSAVHSS